MKVHIGIERSRFMYTWHILLWVKTIHQILLNSNFLFEEREIDLLISLLIKWETLKDELSLQITYLEFMQFKNIFYVSGCLLVEI